VFGRISDAEFNIAYRY